MSKNLSNSGKAHLILLGGVLPVVILITLMANYAPRLLAALAIITIGSMFYYIIHCMVIDIIEGMGW